MPPIGFGPLPGPGEWRVEMTGGSPDDGVRTSDAERTEAVTRLGRALGQGRLSVEEFDQRVAAAYAATTRGELADLIRDLPGGSW